jgi:hypothetical protein
VPYTQLKWGEEEWKEGGGLEERKEGGGRGKEGGRGEGEWRGG